MKILLFRLVKPAILGFIGVNDHLRTSVESYSDFFCEHCVIFNSYQNRTL
jgi:hypothetical protein